MKTKSLLASPWPRSELVADCFGSRTFPIPSHESLDDLIDIIKEGGIARRRRTGDTPLQESHDLPVTWPLKSFQSMFNIFIATQFASPGAISLLLCHVAD